MFIFSIPCAHFTFIFVSGIPQGKLIKRQRLPKDDLGNEYNWKDFNLGEEVVFYGKTFKICDCNEWTKVSQDSF